MHNKVNDCCEHKAFWRLNVTTIILPCKTQISQSHIAWNNLRQEFAFRQSLFRNSNNSQQTQQTWATKIVNLNRWGGVPVTAMSFKEISSFMHQITASSLIFCSVQIPFTHLLTSLDSNFMSSSSCIPYAVIGCVFLQGQQKKYYDIGIKLNNHMSSQIKCMRKYIINTNILRNQYYFRML